MKHEPYQREYFRRRLNEFTYEKFPYEDIIKLWETGKLRDKHTHNTICKIAERTTNQDYWIFLTALVKNNGSNRYPNGMTSKEIFPNRGEKATNDGTFNKVLGYAKIVGKRDGEDVYAITELGKLVVSRIEPMPTSFVYVSTGKEEDEGGKLFHLLATSKKTVEPEYLKKHGSSVSLKSKKNMEKFHIPVFETETVYKPGNANKRKRR